MKSWDANPAPLSTAKQFPASHSCDDQLRVEPVMPTAPPLPSNSPHPGVAWRSGLDQKAQSGDLKPGFEPNRGALRLRPAKSGYSGKPLATKVLHHRNPKPKTMGVTHYGYRFYDPETGRWPSRDPIEEMGGLNLYGFVGNDGMNYWDLLGQKWEKIGLHSHNSRMIYERGETSDTFEELAKIVGLDPTESGKWAIPVARSVGADWENCRYSVPNIYIVADLLQGGGNSLIGSIWSRFVNIGGSIGNLFTFTGDAKRLKVTSASELIKELNSTKGDLLGIVIFAHGTSSGYIGDFTATDWTNQENVMAGVSTGGYKIKTADLMQCYSGAVNPRSGFKWSDKWRPLVHGRLRTYDGMNALGLDMGDTNNRRRPGPRSKW